MSDLTPDQRSLIIQVAKLKGIQVRQNQDAEGTSSSSDFWEWCTPDEYWHGHDRLAKDEADFWQRLAEILTRWGVDPDATNELWLELPDHLYDSLTQEHIEAAKASNLKYDWKRRVVETWVAWKQEQLRYRTEDGRVFRAAGGVLVEKPNLIVIDEEPSELTKEDYEYILSRIKEKDRRNLLLGNWTPPETEGD